MVQDKMDAEKYNYDEWLNRMYDEKPPATAMKAIQEAMINGQAPAMKTILVIEKAISETGMNYDNVMYSIRRYARRNEVMHSMISVYIKKSP